MNGEVSRDLTAIYYRAVRYGDSLRLAVSPAVMARARNGDTGAQNNICISFRKAFQEETGQNLGHVKWVELTFEPLKV